RRSAGDWGSMMSRKRNGPQPRRYEIRFIRAAERGLASLPKPAQRRGDAAILGLAEAPHPPGSKKPRGAGDLDRIRVGDFRVLYTVEHDRTVVLVVDVGNR